MLIMVTSGYGSCRARANTFDVVKNDGTDVLIPFADALVKNIDEDKNILMDLL